MSHSWKGQGVGRKEVAPLGKKTGETGKPLPHPKKLSHLGKKWQKILVSLEIFLNKCD